MGKKRTVPQEGNLYNDFWQAHEAINTNPNTAYGKGRIQATQAPIFRGFNTGYGESKYDEGLNWDAQIDQNDIQGSINENRAQNQSWGAKASAGIGRATTKAAIEVAKLVPTVGGILSAPFAPEGEGWETAFNNTGHQALNALNESINEELLPVYVKKAVKDGDLLTNLSSIDFWATEGADGVGFMAAMFAPGVALKALGGANKFKSILGGFEKGRELMAGAANLGLKADEVGITLANTVAEAAAESGSQMQAMNDAKPEYIKSYVAQGYSPQEAEQMFNEQKARVGRDAFVLNTALLAGTNFINTKMLGLAGESATKKAGNFALRDAEGKIVSSIPSRTFVDRLKDVPKKAGGMFLSEGFVEEGSQSTIENYLKGKAQTGDLSDSTFKDINISELGSEYIDMLTSTEGQKAIALGGILGYGSTAIRSAKQILTGKGTDEDQEINRVNTLLTKGREATNEFFAQVNPDVYKRTEEIDPETGENKFATVNGKKIVDPVKRDQLFLNAKVTEDDGKIWDWALENNDEYLLTHLQNIAEARLIQSFIADSQDGLNILSEHLKDNPTIPEDRKKLILQKAEAVQKSHEQFISYSQPVLNLKNKDAQNDDIQEHYKNLVNINMMNTLQKVTSEKALEDSNKKVNDLLEQHGLTRESLDNEKLRSQLPQRDMRFEKELLLEDYHKSKLEEIKRTNLDLWNPKKQQEAFDTLVKQNKTTRERNSVENIAKVDEITTAVDSATSIEDINNAINGQEETEEIIDGDGNILVVKKPTPKPIDNVDSETAEVLKQQAENKKKEIVTTNEGEIKTGNESIKNEINQKIELPDNIIVFEDGTVMDSYSGDSYANIDEYNRANGIEIPEELPVDTNIHELDQEDVTDIANEKIPEGNEIEDKKESVDKASTAKVKKAFPDSVTLGINTNYKDKNDNIIYTPSKYPSEAFMNFINNSKSVVGTPVTFSIPSYLNDNNKKALDLLNSKKIKFEDFELNILHQYLPLQVNIDTNTYTFIAPAENNSNGKLTDDEFKNTPDYIARKNIVDGIILNQGYEGVTSKIAYQKGGTLTYDKTGQTENKINSLKEFEDKPVPLFFVKDIDGNIYNENGQQAELMTEFPFNLKNPQTQKGYVYTIIHSPGGVATPVKLNVRKINRDQARLIYKVYATLFDYNQQVPSNERLSQYNAKLTDLYKLDNTLKYEIENDFAQELKLFKNQNSITVGDFMTLFIHDNVNYDGTTKPYTTKYQNGQLVVGQEGLLSFTGDSQLSEEEFINFLTTQKRQNTKLSYLAGENNNVDKVKYKDYLLNEVTSVNIDTQQPFKGDINVYISSKVDIAEKPKVINNKSEIEKEQSIINAEFTGQGTTFEIEIKGDNRDFLLTWNRNNELPTLWSEKQSDGSYKTSDAFPTKDQVSKLVDRYVPIEIKDLIKQWTDSSKLPSEQVLDEQSRIEKLIQNKIKLLNKPNQNILEKNPENILNSETNNVSLTDNSYKTEAITQSGLNQLKNLKKKSKIEDDKNIIKSKAEEILSNYSSEIIDKYLELYKLIIYHNDPIFRQTTYLASSKLREDLDNLIKGGWGSLDSIVKKEYGIEKYGSPNKDLLSDLEKLINKRTIKISDPALNLFLNKVPKQC